LNGCEFTQAVRHHLTPLFKKYVLGKPWYGNTALACMVSSSQTLCSTFGFFVSMPPPLGLFHPDSATQIECGDGFVVLVATLAFHGDTGHTMLPTY
jgi:hypothetical protein